MNEEKEVLKKIKKLSCEELGYMRNILLTKYPSDCVLCCDSLNSAELLKKLLFKGTIVSVKCVKNNSDLEDGDNVLFSTFAKIREFRENYNTQIKSFLSLKTLTTNVKNNFFFRQKFPDLMNHFDKMGTGFFLGIIPEKEDLHSLSKDSLERIAGRQKIDELCFKKVIGEENAGDLAARIIQDGKSRVINNGIHNVLEDFHSKYYNVINGMRLTCYQPKCFKHTVFIFGPCTTRGVLVEDKHTVASYLQKMINEKRLPYIVMNCGVGGGSDFENTYRYILSLPIFPGDIVLLLEEGQFLKDLLSEKIFYTAEEFNKNPLQQEWFIDRPGHCNSEANLRLAESFFKRILTFIKTKEKNNCNIRIKKNIQDYDANIIFSVEGNELKEYLNKLEKDKFDYKEGKYYGAIVMHCDPMTLGHKYLIKKALEYVDYLYLFIISEDRGEIPYIVRKQILLSEIDGLENVKVMDSGKYMASITTFPDYFIKDNSRSSRIDASKDILMFCKKVAPILGINKRFLGTEPVDFVTRQYNNLLKIFLPAYGIEVQEFKRISYAGEYISAKKVRSLIKNDQWETVKPLISYKAFNILKEYYDGLNKTRV